MKIVYCIQGTHNSGGMERVLSRKVNYLAQAGHEVSIITFNQQGRKPFFELHPSVACYDLAMPYEQYQKGGILNRLALYVRLPQLHRLHRKRLEQLLLKLKADIVVSMFNEEASFLPSIQDGSHKILEFHFSKHNGLKDLRRGIWRLIDELRAKKDERIVRPFDRFIVLTHEDATLWGDLPNLRVIPNPLPFYSDSPSDCSAHQLLAMGRYDEQKHFDLLIDLWAQLAPDYPDWRLVIAGDGKLRPEHTAQVERLGLNSVELMRPTHQVQELYRASSIYTMTSRYEGLPMVLIEAQQMGLPIVSFACPCGPRDVITDGVDGYLLEVGDHEGFIQALRRLMDSEAERQRMGAAARIASERYDLEHIMKSWLALFDELVHSKQS
ncbi:glycosyltransferase family 4 protein [Porphyromonas sp.]